MFALLVGCWSVDDDGDNGELGFDSREIWRQYEKTFKYKNIIKGK
jgi:hypothetical protein